MLALAALLLVSPVSGDVMRGFDYAGNPFARGHHRGVDLAAAPGTPVRAACGGRVLFAGQAGTAGRAVTVRCGRFNVTHLPLADVTTAAGARIPAGAPIGTAGAVREHAGLHLGVRRASDRFGYVDPASLLRARRPPVPPAGPRTVARRTAPPPSHPPPLPSRPPPRAVPAPTPTEGSSPVAPWPAWAGLALLLAGAAGAGTAGRRRARRAAPARAAPAQVR